MYLPAQFNCMNAALAARLQREYPFASLISHDDEGDPFVTHLPLHLEERAGQWVLLGHVSRGNAHARYLQARPRALVTFQGPHAYLSPKVYPDLVRVPTWNYLALHCKVSATLIDDATAKDQLLKKLIGDHEPAYAAQWRGLGEEYASKMLSAIVAFELAVTHWECKLKLNQHRPESHQAMRQGYHAGNDHDRALGEWMERLAMVPSKDAA